MPCEVRQSNAIDIYIYIPRNLKRKYYHGHFRLVRSYPSKTVVLLSTMHNREDIKTDSEKKKLLLPVFHWFYANVTRCLLQPEIQDGGQIPEVVIIMAMENDINVISAVAAMFSGAPIHVHRHRHRTTPENTIMYTVQTGSSNNLET